MLLYANLTLLLWRLHCQARESGGVLEFRLDYLKPEDLSASNVAKWVELAQSPVVLTLRRRANGGGFDGSEAAQVRILESLSGAFIDLEIETIEGFLGGSLASSKAGSIHLDCLVSQLPRNTRQIYQSIYRRLRNCGANIVKIATQARKFSKTIFAFLNRPKRPTETESQSSLPQWVSWEHSHVLWRLAGVRCGPMLRSKKAARVRLGQFTASELKNLYSVDEINESTQVLRSHWLAGRSLAFPAHP